MSDYSNKLLYGLDDTERIVSVEVNEDHVEIFQEISDGKIKSTIQENQHWIISPTQLELGFESFEGDGYYKFCKRFDTRDEFLKFRQKAKKFRKDIFSIYNPTESVLVDKGITYFKGMKHDEVSVLSFDIETTGVNHDKDSDVLLISNTFIKNGVITRKLFAFDEYDDTGDMLMEWCWWVLQMNPSIITGHNIVSFDFPYLQHVADQHNIQLHLGRNGDEIQFDRYMSKFRKEGGMFLNYRKVKIYGREVVDTLFLAYKHDIVKRQYESYKLKYIINFEGLEDKDRQFYDASQIRFNYKNPVEWKKIKDYCIFDADDALKLYQLMSPSQFYWTQYVPKGYQLITESATGSQINSIMLRAYIQDEHSIPKTTEVKKYEGAISFGNPGIYSNVVKGDIASLYPSIMIEYEVFDKFKDPKGYFKELVHSLTQERLKNKKLAKETKNPYYEYIQQSAKIGINSAYGFLGAPGLAFNSSKKAEFITETGREILEHSIKWAESKKFKICNGDTDSISFIKHDESSFSEKEIENLLKELNDLYPKNIQWENDGYYLKVIIVKAKNYALWDGKKLTIKGSALRPSRREKALQEFIKQIIQCIIDDKYNYTEIYEKYVTEILNISDMSRWSSTKALTEKVMKNDRTQEKKVRTAITDSEYIEGDRVKIYFKEDQSLGLVENFDGDYDQVALLKKLHKTAMIFSTIIPKETFLNYSLKRNQELLKKCVHNVCRFD